MTDDVTISIVIVNYNGRALLAACLPPVLAQATNLKAEVVVVDNGSSDGSAEYVEQAFPKVLVVGNRRNEGFAGGCNAGVRAARGEAIVLLNNDAVPEEGWLQDLVQALVPDDVAVACSVIQEERYPDAYALGTGTISVIGHPVPSVLDDVEHPFYASGCSLAFKRGLFGEPFDPLFFAYYEDTVLSWRAHLRGYRVARALGSRVHHIGSATASRELGTAAFYWERNKLLALLLCYERATLRRLLPLYVFDAVARVIEDIWLLARGRRAPHAVVARYVAALRALGWLWGHAAAVRARRQAIQAERSVTDDAITPLLSGKIFDDHVPTFGHSAANALALAYCRLARIPTAETGSPVTIAC